ncbi:MAG TPA: hypothetical protein VMT61_04555 [Candidatus Binataceae bacterium]|nr:hypothetical protein [Candidatus Binataceae bacterium]
MIDSRSSRTRPLCWPTIKPTVRLDAIRIWLAVGGCFFARESLIKLALMRRFQLVSSLGLFAASASLFILLRTQQYLAVDGAIRCLSVYWLGHPTAGGNNHLLYFVNVFLWTKALSVVGITATNAFDFVRFVHWMNALAAAGSISLLWLLCYGIAERVDIALAATCAYAFSNAFLLHATSTAEPMMGLFWSLASISAMVSGLAASSRLRLFVAGTLLLLAMATYESMVLIGPAELVLIYGWDERRNSDNRTLILWFLAGCIVGVLAAYVPIYIWSGTTSSLAMARRFLAMDGGEQVYGGVSISKLVNLPVGFANSVVPSVPVDYQGIRSLVISHSHDRWILLTSTAVFVMSGWLIWTSFRLGEVWAGLERRRRLILECCVVALLFDTLALIFWDPLYDKLWLQPLAVVFLASSVILSAWYRPPYRLIIAPEALLIAFVTIIGFFHGLGASQSSTPCLDSAHHLAGTLSSSDLLVAGWDPVSLLYSWFWGNGAKKFDVPASASGSGPRTLSLLADEISKTRGSGGSVYFLGVLDLPETGWKPFLEDRCHLPYHSLDGLRRCAKPVAELTCDEHDEVLWQLMPGCFGPIMENDNMNPRN